MKVLVIAGVGMGDDIFTINPKLFGGEEIAWNVTRLRQAAQRGVFGPPEQIPVSLLPPMSALADTNVNMEKVRGMMEKHGAGGELTGVLAEPAINVLVEIGGKLHGIPVDGNHRICAIRMLGREFWTAFLVPPELERQFRVREFVL